MGQNGNVEEAEPVEDQVDVQNINTRANANRLIRRLHSLKGLLTREVNYCTHKVEHFRTLMAAKKPQTQMIIVYARDLLDNYARCQAKHVEVEKGFVYLIKLKTEMWDINDDTGLDTFITGIDTESNIYYKKVNKVRSDNLEIFEKCKILLAPAKAQTSRQAQALWGQVSVNMDSYWFTELQDKGFSRQSNLTSFLKQIEEVLLQPNLTST